VTGRCAPSCEDEILFPETRFPPLAAQQASYGHLVSRGYQIMRTRRVVMAGLARNVAWLLPRTIARIESLGSLFADYRVVIYENDSTDGTREMIHRWSEDNPRVTLLSEVRHDPVNRPIRCLRRAQRMAYYRNKYHDFIAAECAGYDEVMVIDTDLAGGWSFDGIANTYGHGGWDFVGSYGVIYKRLGLRPNCLCHYDAWAFRNNSDYQPLSSRHVNALHWHRGEPMVRVYSCFGGLGIYRTEAFLSGRYDGQDCEHIALHRQMCANGYRRTFLNPSQITIYGRKRRKLDDLMSLCEITVAACTLRPSAVWY